MTTPNTKTFVYDPNGTNQGAFQIPSNVSNVAIFVWSGGGGYWDQTMMVGGSVADGGGGQVVFSYDTP